MNYGRWNGRELIKTCCSHLFHRIISHTDTPNFDELNFIMIQRAHNVTLLICNPPTAGVNKMGQKFMAMERGKLEGEEI